MSNTNDDKIKFPLHEAIEIIKFSVYLQTHKESEEEFAECAIPYLQGPPGDGKTQMIKNLCRKNNWGFVSCHFALEPIEKFTGIPKFIRVNSDNDDKQYGTFWSIPELITKIMKISKNHEKVVLLLDDIHLCGATHMAYLYEPLTERAFNGHRLPDNCAILLAGNDSNKAGAKTPFSAIMNRVQIMPIYQDFDYWKKNYAIPNSLHHTIVSFLSNDTYKQYFREQEQMETPWGSPRSWTRLSNLVQLMEYNIGKSLNETMILFLASGHVSKEAAGAFSAYYNIYTKISPTKILNQIKNDSFEMPTDVSEKYITAHVLNLHMANAENNDFNKYLETFCKFILMLSIENKELIIMMLRDMSEYDGITKARKLSKILNKLNAMDREFNKEILKVMQDI